MALLALLGYGSFVVVSLVVGVRLLLLWRRTQETPELAIAVALLAGALSYAFAIAAFSAPGLSRIGASLLEMVGGFFAHLGAAALALALRHIFRPDAGWARTLQLTVTVFLALSFATRLVDPLAFPPPGFVFWPYAALGAFVYGWSAFESLRYYRTMQRGAQTGLAEPGNARAFLLWGAAALAGVGIHVAAMVDQFFDPAVIAPWMVPFTSALGLIAAAGLWLAFFPLGARGVTPLRIEPARLA